MAEADPHLKDRLLNELSSSLTPATEGIASEIPAPPPPVIPDHTLLRCIGRGSYGEVWLARNALGTWRAVKIVYRRAFDSDRPYEREFTGIRRFEPVSRTHPSQLNVLHVGRDDAAGLFYYVMELADPVGNPKTEDRGPKEILEPESEKVQAQEDALTSAFGLHSDFGFGDSDLYQPRTLRSDLHHRGRLPHDECLRLGLALATALDHLHHHGLVHRDIKPSNIVFVNGIPKLADIGLVTHVEATISFVGTEGYVPPEGPGTAQADIYSLGKVLYEMATGRDRQDYPDLPTNLIEVPAADRAALAELNEVIVKACHNDARQRYQTAAELHADLALLQSGASVRRQRLLARQLRFVQRAGAVVTAMAAVIALGWWWQARQTEQVRELADENLALAERADANATLAEKNELAARERLYAADINLAFQALKDDNLRLAQSLLENHVPQPGQPDLRGFEWRYLWQRTRSEELLTFPCQSTGSRVLAMSPDGAQVAVGGYEGGHIRLLDVSLRRVVATLQDTNAMMTLAYSPDGRSLVSGSASDVRLWDPRSFTEIRRFTNAVAPAVFSPDGRFLLTGRDPWVSPWNVKGWDDPKKLLVWDTATWTVLHTATFPVSGRPSGSRDLYLQVAFGNDSRQVAVLTGGTTRLLSCPELKEVRVLPEDLPESSTSRPFLALSPDNRTLAIPSPTGYGVRLWNTVENRELRILPGHTDHIFSARFSPDGQWLATASPDQTIKLWQVATGELLHTFRGQADEVIDVVFSADGTRLASLGITESVVKLWDAHLRPRSELLPRGLWPQGFEPGGQLVVLGRRPERQPLSFDPTDFKLAPLPHPQVRDGFPAANKLHSISPDGRFHGLWDRRELMLEVWDRRDGTLKCTVPNRTPYFSFDRRGRLLATATTNSVGEPRIAVWDLPAGRLKWEVGGAKGYFSLFPTSAGDYVLTQKEDQMQVARVEEDRLSPVLNLTVPIYLASAAISPDGRLLATAEGDITLRDLPEGQTLGVLKGHTRKTVHLAFSPDSRTLASISDDHTTRLWHVATQRELLRFPAATEDRDIFQVEFSPDGRALASYRHDGTNAMTSLYFAPSFAEIAVAEGGDYLTLAGEDPATWLAVAKALQRENRWEEALKACDEVLRRTANREELAWLAGKARPLRVSALKQLNRLEEAGAENCVLLGIRTRDPATPPNAIDLSAFYNAALAERPRPGENASDLSELRQGIQTLDGTVFDVRGQIALRGRAHDQEWQFESPCIDGIRVGRRLARLHFLHAAGGWDENIKTGDRLGHYLVHYEDGRSVVLPVRFNVDTSDWWAHARFPKELPEAAVAWQGFTARNRPEGAQAIRLFKRTWQNPFPDAEVTMLDFVAEHPRVHPFLIGLTAE